MSLYKQIRNLWKKPKQSMPDVWRERLIQWRREPTTLVVKRPTRLDRARSLGYKAKQGIIVVRQRVPRGGHRRPRPKKGRRPKRYGTRLNLDKNYQEIAEERVAKKFRNLAVVNSYQVIEDGKYYWFEIILADPHHPVIKADKNLAWLQMKKNQRKVFHGKTSAGKKSRGMRG
jgi:large subunit ribosomal protein L15e